MGPLLGKGGFGVVHQAIEKRTGDVYAVKTLPKRFGPGGVLAAAFAERVVNEVCCVVGVCVVVCIVVWLVAVWLPAACITC